MFKIGLFQYIVWESLFSIQWVILPLLLIQEGKCQYMHKYRLTAQKIKLAQETVSKLTDWLDMTLTVLTGL